MSHPLPCPHPSKVFLNKWPPTYSVMACSKLPTLCWDYWDEVNQSWRTITVRVWVRISQPNKRYNIDKAWHPRLCFIQPVQFTPHKLKWWITALAGEWGESSFQLAANQRDSLTPGWVMNRRHSCKHFFLQVLYSMIYIFKLWYLTHKQCEGKKNLFSDVSKQKCVKTWGLCHKNQLTWFNKN